MNSNPISYLHRHPHPQPQLSAPSRLLSRADLEAVLENIVQLQLERATLEAEQNRELTALREKYREPLAEIERFLALETGWAEAWARDNPDAFSERRSLECTQATIGFRLLPPRLERVQENLSWAEIAQRVEEQPWGRSFLRWPEPLLDKNALLTHRATLSPEQLRAVGLEFAQGDRFYISPRRTVVHAQLETVWAEAA